MAMTEISLRQPLRYTIDLSAGLVQQPMRGQLMKGDKKANRVIVHLTDGRKDAVLSGVTVTGSFIRPPDAAEIPLKGEASGSEASVTLEDACYATEGYCEIDVKLTVGETSRTILTLTGYVLSKGSGAYVDVSGVIPNIDDVIAQYAEMKRVTQETQAAGAAAGNAAGAANTAAYEANRQAQAAQNAAGAANTAAAKIDGMTVSAEKADEAGATISQKDGAYHVNFKLPKGDTGATPDITFEVATGAAGSDVQLEQSGTPEAPHIKLTIPRGDTGAVEGIDYYEGNPEALGTASPGTANGAARGNHVHPKPTPEELGAASKEQLNQLTQQMADYRTSGNLLINSDFANPVNLNGYVSGTSGVNAYCIDRWKLQYRTALVLNNGYVTLTGEYDFGQVISTTLKAGVTYSACAKVRASGGTRNMWFVIDDSTGTRLGGTLEENSGEWVTLVFSFTPNTDISNVYLYFTNSGDANVNTDIAWVALYEGSYTVETLSPYVPKGYSNELLACEVAEHGDVLSKFEQQIANKVYNLNVSAISSKVEFANCTMLSCVGNVGYYRLSFHVTEQVDNGEVIFTITGFHKELLFADAFVAMGIDKVFFFAGCSIAGNAMSLVSNAGNDVGYWFHMPVIVFFKD